MYMYSKLILKLTTAIIIFTKSLLHANYVFSVVYRHHITEYSNNTIMYPNLIDAKIFYASEGIVSI